MAYEINVSLNGKHLFATHEGSVQSMVDLADVLPQILKRFPEHEGFKITVIKYQTVGQQLTDEMIQAYNVHKPMVDCRDYESCDKCPADEDQCSKAIKTSE